MTKKPPKIIFTNRPSSNNLNRGTILTLTCREFINFVEIDDIKSVFSAYEPKKKNREYFMFAIKDGFIINASYQDIEHLALYYEIESWGCEDFFEFLELQHYPIEIRLEKNFLSLPDSENVTFLSS